MAEAELEPDNTEEETTEELPQAADGAEESTDDTADSDEVEVVLTGDAPEPEMIPKSALTKRAARYVRKIDAQQTVIDEQSKELEELRAKTPKLEDVDFDESAHAAAMSDHNAILTAATVRAELKRAQGETAAEAQAREAESQQLSQLNQHYERAEQLKVPDYEAAEDSATEAMGESIISEIARSAPNSELIIYYLGKNPVKAKALADTMRSNPFMGTIELGKLTAGLSAQPKSNKAPDPVDPVEGGAPGAQAKWDKELAKAQKLANETGRMDAVRDVRRRMKAANVS